MDRTRINTDGTGQKFAPYTGDTPTAVTSRRGFPQALFRDLTCLGVSWLHLLFRPICYSCFPACSVPVMAEDVFVVKINTIYDLLTFVVALKVKLNKGASPAAAIF